MRRSIWIIFVIIFLSMILISVKVKLLDPSKKIDSVASANEPDIVKITYIQHPDDTFREGSEALKYLEKKTNTHIKLTIIPYEGGKEKRNVLLSSGDIPDLISIQFERALANTYGEQGLFASVDKLIEIGGPHMLTLLDRKVSGSIRSDNGQLYQIPSILEDQMIPQEGFIYRKDLMDNLGLKEPETLEEWYNALKLVKQKYPELIPLEIRGGFSYINWALSSAFDIRTVSGYTELWNGKIQSWATSEKFKQLLQFAHKLYSEDLIEQDYMTKSHTQWWGDITSGRVFSFWFNYHRADQANTEGAKSGLNLNFAAAEQVIGINGKRQIFTQASPAYELGFAISAESKVKAAVMRILDFIYSEEGAEWWYYGLEGISYNKVGKEIQIIGSVEEWLQRLKEIGATPRSWPRNIPMEYFMEGPNGTGWSKLAIDAITRNNNHTIVLPKPPIPRELEKEMASISSLLDPYFNRFVDEFITGTSTFDKWSEYVNGMEALKLSRTVEIVQQAFDIYRDSTNQTGG